VTGVLADAEFGDNRLFRALLHRLHLPYAVGISSSHAVFLGTPRLQAPRPHTRGRPRKHPTLATNARTRALAEAIGAAGGRWRRIHWRNRPEARRWTADCVAIRVTPAVDCRQRRLAPEIWLLAERDVGETPRTKFYFVNLPPTASLPQIVRLAHQRWAIEQQYQDLKTELGLDHFEGRTFAGWQHHVVLTAITYNFLQAERQRARVSLTFPSVRGIVQEIFTAYLFAQRPQYLTRIEALRSVQLRI
jgi:SRSO17 transposase